MMKNEPDVDPLEEPEPQLIRKRVPETENVYVIETFDGEVISHSREGPLLFTDVRLARAFMRKLEPSKNSMRFTVTEVTMRHGKMRSLVDFGLQFMDDLEMPAGGQWIRDYQDGKPPRQPRAAELKAIDAEEQAIAAEEREGLSTTRLR